MARYSSKITPRTPAKAADKIAKGTMKYQRQGAGKDMGYGKKSGGGKKYR